MEEIQILEAVEKYIRGEMTPEERTQFEELRRTNSEIDQLVVEQTMFFNQLGNFSDWKALKVSLNEVHNHLAEQGEIRQPQPKGVVRELWRRYKRVMAVAASIAGITTLLIATTVSMIARKQSTEDLQQLRREFRQEVANKKKEVLNEVDNKIKISKAPENIAPKSGGTGFLIDGKGYLVTNAHVVNNANSVIVLNSKGQEFRANIIHINIASDLAVLRIEDNDFKPLAILPYSIRKSGTDLGEQLFTLGYPRNEIVYNEGYMSAKTGYKGDTLTCQIGVQANPGNSGGPVFNKNGEVVGIINTREKEAEGVVFAVTARNIFLLMDDIRKSDTAARNIKLPLLTTLRNLDRTQQIRKIEECVFMVKTY
ncbi:MAG: trypsin-like peptidase domain-containing protein [Chitinophagaceae bacterium]|nr:trypsin-like peptidase domain-containing protein [Chitinophagaceae bacterium]